MGKMYFPQYIKGRKEGIVLMPGKSVLEHIKKLGMINLEPGKDIIRVGKGANLLNALTTQEKKLLSEGKLKSGQRLASEAKVIAVDEDVRVFVSDSGQYTILTDIIKIDTNLNPETRRTGKRIYHGSKNLAPYKGKIYGLAVDIGTTTVVMQVVDLESGKNIYRPVAFKNPQIAYGNDIISRIGHTIDNPRGLKELQQAVVEGINESLVKLEKESASRLKEHIYDIVIVGNSTMREIFFGNNVKSLGLIPFEPLKKDHVLKSASGLGLDVGKNALVYGPALIGGHAGADCLADIIASSIYKNDEVSMIIDIGTNGEIVIGNNKKMYTASCAAGGAYEGYQISCGVGAVAGAITGLKIKDGEVKYSTLAEKPPVGICGSGVIDLLAELYRNKIMDRKTRIKQDFHIDGGIYITQDDINQLIIAKAGLRTDQDLLVKYYGITYKEVEKIYLAGAFGNYMDIENAITIGLLPDVDKTKFVRFGNGALAGAISMLFSKQSRTDAEWLKDFIEHKKPNEIEGSNFQYEVADNMYFN